MYLKPQQKTLFWSQVKNISSESFLHGCFQLPIIPYSLYSWIFRKQSHHTGTKTSPFVYRCLPTPPCLPAALCLWLPSPSFSWSLHVSQARLRHSAQPPTQPGAALHKKWGGFKFQNFSNKLNQIIFVLKFFHIQNSSKTLLLPFTFGFVA